jgi:uncharacterized protein YifN (PemK superfamily)
MPLTFHPGPGTIVVCDYTTGFKPPEMVKIRPVVVISSRRRGLHLATVVPLSSTAPQIVEPWHVPISAASYPIARGPMWAKCDMIATVSMDRLDRVKVKVGGVRSYQAFLASPADLAAILAGVRAALGLP